MSWLTEKPKVSWLEEKSKDSFLEPIKARGATFLEPDVTREKATARVTGEHHLREAIHLLHEQDGLSELRKATTTASIKVAESCATLVLDPPTFAAVRLEQEKVKADLERARGLSEIKITEAEQMDINRVKVLRQEREIDIQGVIGLGLKDLETLDYISYKIETLQQQNASPQRLKNLEEYRDRLARKIFQEVPGQNVGAGDEADYSNTGD